MARQIIATILLLIFLRAECWAFGACMGVAMSVAGSGTSCDTAVYTPTALGTSTHGVGYNELAQAGLFTAQSTAEICAATISGTENGTGPTQTWHLEIWSDNAGVPGSQIGGDSDTFNPADFPADPTYGDIAVTWSSDYPSLTSGTNYHTVVVSNNMDGDFTNHYEVQSATPPAGSGALNESDDMSTWVNISSSSTNMITLLKSSGGAATPFFQANFINTGGTDIDLTTYTPEIGSSTWVHQASDFDVVANSGGYTYHSGVTGQRVAVNDVTTPSDDYTVTVEGYNPNDSTFEEWGACARASSSDDGYCAYVEGRSKLFLAGGGLTESSVDLNQLVPSSCTNCSLVLTVSGTSISAEVFEGTTSRGTHSDTDATITSGKPGVWIAGSSSVIKSVEAVE